MKVLTKYHKNGFAYKIDWREQDVAIASQTRKSGGLQAYEVICIKQVPETTILGKRIESCEAPPSNRDWGTRGWTYSLDTVGRDFQAARVLAHRRALAKAQEVLAFNREAEARRKAAK